MLLNRSSDGRSVTGIWSQEGRFLFFVVATESSADADIAATARFDCTYMPCLTVGSGLAVWQVFARCSTVYAEALWALRDGCLPCRGANAGAAWSALLIRLARLPCTRW